MVSEARRLWLNAALAFDPERGARFNTFAYMAVRRKLNLIIDQDGPLLQVCIVLLLELTRHACL